MKRIILWIKNCLIIVIISMAVLVALSIARVYNYVNLKKEQQKELH